jgi:hypothetical protein
MTVGQLIELLSKLPQDSQVLVYSPMVYFEDLLPESIATLQVCEVPAHLTHRSPFPPFERVRNYDYPENCEQNSPIVRAVLIAQ